MPAIAPVESSQRLVFAFNPKMSLLEKEWAEADSFWANPVPAPAVASTKFAEDRTWTTLDVGGPILRDHLFFFGSYYRPTRTRSHVSCAYRSMSGCPSAIARVAA